MKKITELRNKLKANADEMTKLSTNPEALAAAGGTARITELFTEDDNLRAAIDTELKNEQMVADLATRAASSRSYLNDPATDHMNPSPANPNPGTTFERGTDYSAVGGANVLGYTPAGRSFIERRSDGSTVITADGHGLLSAAKMDKLCTREYTEAFMGYIRSGGDSRKMSDIHWRALQEGLDDQGGFLVPPEIALRLIQRLPTPTSLSPRYFTWPTSRDRVTFPKVNYTGSSTDDPNAYLYSTGVRMTYNGEIPNDQNTVNTTQPSFGEVEVPVYTAMGALDVTRNMIEDSPTGIMAFIESKFRETAMLEYDNRSVNGTGTGQATGIISGQTPISGATSTTVPQYIATTAASALTADGIKALAFSLAPQYLDPLNTVFAMNWNSTAQAISELKDGQGRYLWSDGNQDNGLSNSILDRRLLGFQAIYSNFIPSVAANAFPIIFGDLSGYYLVQRLGLSIQILFETKAKQNMLEVVCRMRFGGLLAEPWKVKVQKVAVS